MSVGDWVTVVVTGVWLIGVGLLAHAVPAILDSDEIPDFMRPAMDAAMGRLLVWMTFVIVSWPVSIPFMIVMMKRKEKGK